MPELPPSSQYLQYPDQKVSDAERSAMSDRLSDAYAEGRLEHERYMTLMDQLYSAGTYRELAPIAAALPAPATQVPDIVRTGGSVPAGQVTQGRSMVVPGLVVGGVMITLIMVIVVLLVVL